MMKTLFGIRHARWLWHFIEFHLWWHDVGRYMGAVPNAADLTYLRDVWNGER